MIDVSALEFAPEVHSFKGDMARLIHSLCLVVVTERP